jgi:hypothetical protein
MRSLLCTDEGDNLGRFNLPEYDPHLLLHVNLVHCCFLFEVRMARAGLFDPSLSMEKIGNIDPYPGATDETRSDVLYRYRLHETSMTSELIRGTAQHGISGIFDVLPALPLLYIGKRWWWLRLAIAASRVRGRTNWIRLHPARRQILC